jgi:uncharacterized membrane protein
MPIRNPIEWSADQVRHAAGAAEAVGRAVHRDDDTRSDIPVIRRIGTEDLNAALRKGWEDFRAYRTDVIFISLVYPVIGLVLARALLHADFLALVFPLAAGFALLGPLAAIGLYEMSRRREEGSVVGWTDAFGVVRSPAFAAISVMALLLLAIFLAWLAVAQVVYTLTLGPMPPASIGAFAETVLETPAGWALIVVGCGIGFLFAVLVLSISIVSFPMLLDRDVGVGTAIRTSLRAVATNPVPLATWGLIVAGALLAGSIPLFIGLIVVLPVFGHATWHLYRALVPST